ncbi:TRAP transporter substrate-binding protein [Roseinatronobacter sp. S2]|uniref:TRAP transporter substrate-binding protein n=1 Tax=Roseinatronobacter sp. S2 TaxID=3035471 RepID=UPI00240F6D3B|nr:TRAP transporter substrate-binding protein [Roseinatronobacter sp. S2]WFE74669.1 TRAP transporter substrate-binding protein [Roseinatronobacter sp. S2]
MTKTLLATGLGFLLATTSLSATEVKIAMNGVNDPVTNAEAAFAAGFAEALEGTGFDVNIFPSDTLGSERERFDQVAQGLLEINLATVSTTYGMSPMVRGVALPFMFEDGDEFDAVIAQSDLLDQMNEPLVRNGVRLVGFTYIGMPNGIHNRSHAVTKMEDLSSLRLRALNAEQLAYIEALGASGTIVAWAEVANAIQTGIADGYINPPNSAIRTGHTEFLRHFTQIAVTPSTRIVLMSEDWYDMLSDEEKTQIDAAIDAGVAANRAWIEDWSSIVTERHVDAGVTLSELEDGEREKMVEATRPTWDDVMEADHLAAYLDALELVRN